MDYGFLQIPKILHQQLKHKAFVYSTTISDLSALAILVGLEHLDLRPITAEEVITETRLKNRLLETTDGEAFSRWEAKMKKTFPESRELNRKDRPYA